MSDVDSSQPSERCALFLFLEPECGLVVVITSMKPTQSQPTTSSCLSQILKKKPHRQINGEATQGQLVQVVDHDNAG
jgi:hypothetical protein